MNHIDKLLTELKHTGSFHSILSIAETTFRKIISRIFFQSQSKPNPFRASIVGVYKGFIIVYKTLIKIKRGRGYKELNSGSRD